MSLGDASVVRLGLNLETEGGVEPPVCAASCQPSCHCHHPEPRLSLLFAFLAETLPAGPCTLQTLLCALVGLAPLLCPRVHPLTPSVMSVSSSREGGFAARTSHLCVPVCTWQAHCQCCRGPQRENCLFQGARRGSEEAMPPGTEGGMGSRGTRLAEGLPQHEGPWAGAA